MNTITMSNVKAMTKEDVFAAIKKLSPETQVGLEMSVSHLKKELVSILKAVQVKSEEMKAGSTMKFPEFGFVTKNQLKGLVETLEGEDLVSLFYNIKTKQDDFKEDSESWNELEVLANRVTERTTIEIESAKVETEINEYEIAFRKLFEGINMKRKKKTTIVIGEYDVEVDSLPNLGRYERLIEAYDFISKSESLIEGDAEFTNALIKRVKEFATFMKKWNGTNGIEEEVYLGYKKHCVRIVSYAKATLVITTK